MFIISLIVITILETHGAQLGPWLLVIPLGGLGFDVATAAFLQSNL